MKLWNLVKEIGLSCCPSIEAHGFRGLQQQEGHGRQGDQPSHLTQDRRTSGKKTFHLKIRPALANERELKILWVEPKHHN